MKFTWVKTKGTCFFIFMFVFYPHIFGSEHDKPEVLNGLFHFTSDMIFDKGSLVCHLRKLLRVKTKLPSNCKHTGDYEGKHLTFSQGTYQWSWKSYRAQTG